MSSRRWSKNDAKVREVLGLIRRRYVSALVRRERDQSIDAASTRKALDQLRKLGDEWHEVLPTRVLRNAAERLLRVHVLRAADAVQLAAALTAAADDPSTLEFFCLDQRLKDAAEREGFRVR